MSKVIAFLKQDHIDVTIRITICSFIGYVFGVARLPEIIPPSQASFIGWITALLASMLPTLPMVTALGLSAAAASFGALLFATMLLAVTVAGGNGALTAAFSGTVLWISCIRFFPGAGTNTAMLIVFITLNVLGLYEAVQGPSGMDIVTSLWTETGLENSAAVVSNTMIAWGWIVAIISVGPLLPPWKTARNTIYKGLLPSLLNDAAQHIRLNLQEEGKNGSGKNRECIDCDDGGLQLLNPKEKQSLDDQIVERITRSAIMLDQGKMAGMTAFEPRLLRCAPPSCSFIILKQLCLAVRDISLRTLMASRVKLSKGNYPSSYSEVAESLDECAQLLRKGESLEEKEVDRNAAEDAPKDDNIKLLRDTEDPYRMKEKVKAMKKLIAAWLDEVGPPDRTASKYCSKDALRAIMMNALPWILVIGGWFKNLVYDVPKLLISREHWKEIFDPICNSRAKAAWVIKHAIGATALFCMSIYWDAYKDWELLSSDYPDSHFQGWAIIAFHFTTTQTSEGTVKKGLLRLFATLCGGFSGWLCITAVDDDPYGMVAWLTVTTVVAVFLGTKRGFEARLGLSKDHGYANQNFILTQGIIVIYFRNQEGTTRDELVVNRIVANCLGIGVGILMSLIPPNVWGGDPRIALNIARIEKNALAKILCVLRDRCSDTFEDNDSVQKSIDLIMEAESFKNTSIAPLFAEANDLIVDSSRFSTSPFFRVDPKLKEKIGLLGIHNSTITMLSNFARCMISNKDDRNVFAPGMPLHKDLSALLELIDKNECQETKDEESSINEKADLVGPPLFVEIVRLVVNRLHFHEADLLKIKYGYGQTPKTS